MPDQPALRIAVLQPGARLHYAVPTLLQRAGMLQRLYTDFANLGALRNLEKLWPRCLQPAAARRFFGRKLPPEVPSSKVRQVPYAVLRERMTPAKGGSKSTSSQALLSTAMQEHFAGANAIYTVLVNEDLDACRAAKAIGCRIIHEVMLTPDVGPLTAEEYRRYATPSHTTRLGEIAAGRERDRQKYALADLILVPSEFVRGGVVGLGADPAKVALVPYGIDKSWLERPSYPVPGRVLFVGSVGLRKGSHYLAEAARCLAERGIDCEVRVAGPLEAGVAQSAIFAGPTYLGQVPRADIHREYSHADIFVLPSLAEGMAIATLEAMAMGLPVITTPNAGSCVRDGIDGIIVPPADAFALMTAIERLLFDRDLRETMSRNAKARASDFTWEKYEGRLIAALSRLQAPEAVAPKATASSLAFADL